eukprot:7666929-Pyramimonas_sp.AAC.2
MRGRERGGEGEPGTLRLTGSSALSPSTFLSLSSSSPSSSISLIAHLVSVPIRGPEACEGRSRPSSRRTASARSAPP